MKNITNEKDKIIKKKYNNNYIHLILILTLILITNISSLYSYSPINLTIKNITAFNKSNIFYYESDLCNITSKYCQNDTHILLNYTNAFIEIYYNNNSYNNYSNSNMIYIQKFYITNLTYIKKNFTKAKIYTLEENYINHTFYIYNNNFKSNKEIIKTCLLHNINTKLCNIVNMNLNINDSDLIIDFPFEIKLNIINNKFMNFTTKENISINYKKIKENIYNKTFYDYDIIIYNNTIINFDFNPIIILDKIKKPLYYGENFKINNKFTTNFNLTINQINQSFLNLKYANYTTLVEKRNKIISNNLFNSDLTIELKQMINYFIESK